METNLGTRGNQGYGNPDSPVCTKGIPNSPYLRSLRISACSFVQGLALDKPPDCFWLFGTDGALATYFVTDMKEVRVRNSLGHKTGIIMTLGCSLCTC